MIAAWMVYSTLCALGLFAGAVLAERALLRGNGAVRPVWIAAIALSIVLPIAAFRLASQAAPIVSAPASVPQVVTHDAALPGGELAHFTAAQSIQPEASRNWRATLARFDRLLAVAWIVLSLALALKFLAGMGALAWMRRRWTRHSVLGTPVFVSERTGPAVVGVVSPLIVLPRWVLGLDAAQLRLLLRHEQEHCRAADGQLLALAELALIAMPWNIALWWQIVRLRVAVELDCDARVLRTADARTYGDLLLEVARPDRTARLMGATAFAERAVQLDRRIRMLPRHRTRTSRAARALATCIGVMVVTVAWVAPHPAAPPRVQKVAVERSAVTAPLPVTAIAAGVARSDETATTKSARSTTPRRARAAKQPAEIAVVPVLLPISEGALAAPCDLSRAPDIALTVESIYDLLFAGITLTKEQEARACSQLMALQRLQLEQDQAVAAANAAADAKRVQRNTALRALLGNDADRATFDAHATRSPTGFFRHVEGTAAGALYELNYRRVQRGDTTVIVGAARGGAAGAQGAVARGGGAGGGGRGGRGSGNDTVAAQFARLRVREAAGAKPARFGFAGDYIGEFTLRQLFNGITLTPEQETTARTIIEKTEQEIIDAHPAGQVHIRLNPRGVVTVQPESKAALAAIITNDADRATLESRLVTTVILRQ